MEDEVGDAEPKPSTSRRTWTMRNNAARQVAVNFMPSRQLPHNTLRVRRNNSEQSALLEECREVEEVEDGDSSEQQANIIVREMEQHQQLMEDNLQAEELRREALRDLPQGLTMKRNIRAKLSASVSLRSKHRPISVFKRFKYRVSFAVKRVQDRCRNLIFSVELWYEAIRKVEGHLGSAVASYFYFLRWLFLLNLAISLLVMGFVVVPQLLYDQTSNSTYSVNATESTNSFLDFISGKGMLEDTVMFYGHYNSHGANSTDHFSYNITFGYFYTMLTVYLVAFLVLCYRTAYSYRRNFIRLSAGHARVSGACAAKLLCGWDHGIASGHAAMLTHKGLYNEFKELLSEQNKSSSPTTLCTTLCQYGTNAAVGVAVGALIVGLEVGFWCVLSMRADAMETLRASEYWATLLTLAVTAVLAVCPFLFGLVGRLEWYRPRTALYVALARTFCLDITTLFLLLVFWASSQQHCWETALGQETYRLILFDAFFSIIVLPIIEFGRGFIYKMRTGPLPRGGVVGGQEEGRGVCAPPQFDIARNSLTLVYTQSALWLGLVFSPPLALAAAVKFLLLFYVKRECALRACQPATKVWRAAQTQTVLYMLVNLSLFITLFALGSLFVRGSSHSCGPFRDYAEVYSVLSEGLLRLSTQPTLRSVLAFVTRPGVIAFLMLFLCVWVYYMRAKSLAQQSMVSMLRQMLVLEAKDKDFLLAAINKVSNGEWTYSPKANDHTRETHTWKYLNDDNVRKPSNAGFHFDVSRLNHSLLDNSRPRSYMSAKEHRPNSYFKDRPKSYGKTDETKEDGDTDSSFSWQGSGCLNQEPDDVEVREDDGSKKWL